MNYYITLFLLAIFFSSENILAQSKDTCQSVLLIRKGQKLLRKKDMASANNTGFYLFRNCLYQFTLKSGVFISGRITDVKKDSIEFAIYPDKKLLPIDGLNLRSKIKVHYNQIEKFWLIADRSLGVYSYLYPEKYDFIFEKDTICATMPIEKVKIYQNKDYFYEVLPMLTQQGMDLMYEDEGVLYAYWGDNMIKEEKQPNQYQVRNGIWFTPSSANEINGVNIGLVSKNIDENSLQINGLSLELNVFSFPAVLFTMFQQKDIFKDSTHFSNETANNSTYIKGLNISVLGTNGCGDIEGLNIGGLITSTHNLNGVSVSGLCNFSDKMNGISIAAIQNYTNECKGVQIGLFNRAKKLRGFQFGLWNVNEKRSLPFINWQFKDKKSKKKQKKE